MGALIPIILVVLVVAIILGSVAILWVTSADTRLAIAREETKKEELYNERAAMRWYGIQGLVNASMPYMLAMVAGLALIGVFVLAYFRMMHAPQPPTPAQLPPVNVNIAIVSPDQATNRGKQLELVARSGRLERDTEIKVIGGENERI